MKVYLDEGAFAPERAHEADAGLDLRTPADFTIYNGEGARIDTGVHVEIPKGYVGMLKSKSGLNVNYGIVSEGVIDSGYTGSIVVKLYMHGERLYHDFEAGDKITQLVVMPCALEGVELVDSSEFADTERGDGGFGSTGR